MTVTGPRSSAVRASPLQNKENNFHKNRGGQLTLFYTEPRRKERIFWSVSTKNTVSILIFLNEHVMLKLLAVSRAQSYHRQKSENYRFRTRKYLLVTERTTNYQIFDLIWPFMHKVGFKWILLINRPECLVFFQIIGRILSNKRLKIVE